MSLTKVSYSMINGDVLNILDYGAVADADCTAAFTAAIAAASASKKTIFIPAGTYPCGQIELLSNVAFVGEPGSIIKRTGNYGWVTESGADNITIDSLEFDCNAPGTAGTHKYCLSVLNVTVTNLTVRNCKFYNGYDIAIKNAGPDGIYISNVGSGAPSATRNNILIENCTFDGFTRNGISITNGANGVNISGCLFTNNGLRGIDVEADYGTYTYIIDLTIQACRFIDNGAGSIRGTDVAGGALQIINPSPVTFHSKNVAILNCYFSTPTAVNTLGISYFLIDSTETFYMAGCVFDVPVSVSTHSVTFESGTYGSQYGLIENNIFRVPVTCFTFALCQFNNNQFIGSLASFTSAALGIRKTLSNNLFYQAGSGATSPITIGSVGTNITNNRFYDDRASLVPTNVIKYSAANTTSLAVLDWTIAGNTVASINLDYGFFFSLTGGSSNYGVQNIRFRGNDISNCGRGIEFASSSSTLPNCFDMDVTDNTFTALSSTAINMNGVGRFTCNGNSIKDCATNTIALNITRSDRYVCSNNRITDTRAGGARSTYAISAQNTQAGTPTSLLSSNLSVNTQSGFTINAGEGTSVNNTVY
jgi:hypothetical protein